LAARRAKRRVIVTAENHIASYYAATANDRTQHPSLEGTVKADVCVVGGGFSGVATALTMAERGRSVVLIEANRIGWGASGRNGGQMIGGISGEATIERQLGAAGAKLVRDIRYCGHQIIEERIAKYNIACDLKHGWMEAAARPRHMTAIRDHVEQRIKEGEGDHLEIVEPEAMPRVLGTAAYHGGFIDRKSGHLHGLNLCLGEARAAASLGVRIFEDTRAIGLDGGAKPWVRTERGRVEASTVVIAGEIFDGFDQPRLQGLMLPTGSYIIATEPLSEAVASEINPQDLAVADSNVVLDYFRLSADRRMLFGGRCNYGNRDPKDIRASIKPRMLSVFPQLADAKVDFAWGGRIAIIVNRVPAIGRLKPNLYYMRGYSGHGVNATHIAADIVSDAILGTTEKFDLFDRIEHIRLPMSDWFGNQMLALGMLYYRLRDLL
jgi:gamma-glutamylputrescine oxidase